MIQNAMSDIEERFQKLSSDLRHESNGIDTSNSFDPEMNDPAEIVRSKGEHLMQEYRCIKQRQEGLEKHYEDELYKNNAPIKEAKRIIDDLHSKFTRPSSYVNRNDSFFDLNNFQ